MLETNHEGNRILVIARPALGRRIAEILGTAGYEVYRTPSGFEIAALADRIRPHLGIVSVDLLVHDGVGAALALREEALCRSVLLIGDASLDRRADRFPIVSATDPTMLLCTVAHMLRSPVSSAQLIPGSRSNRGEPLRRQSA
jgi:hypothetical protein